MEYSFGIVLDFLVCLLRLKKYSLSIGVKVLLRLLREKSLIMKGIKRN
jgi:hypothetical protein